MYILGTRTSTSCLVLSEEILEVGPVFAKLETRGSKIFRIGRELSLVRGNVRLTKISTSTSPRFLLIQTESHHSNNRNLASTNVTLAYYVA